MVVDTVAADSPTAMVTVVVPASFFGVADFAFTADAVYPILNIAGHSKLVRCRSLHAARRPR